MTKYERRDNLIALINIDQMRRIEEQSDPSDCALGAWCDGLNAGKLQIELDIIANGGNACFLAVITLAGEPVRAKMIDTKYGGCWALLDDRGKITGQFLPICDALSEPGTPYIAKDAKLRKRGFRQVAVMRPAEARIVGTGRGLAGTAYPCAIDPVTGQGQCAWLASEA